MLRDIAIDLSNTKTKYNPLLKLLLKEYDYYDASKPSFPTTQQELYQKLNISPTKLKTMLKHLNSDFYYRFKGYISSEEEDEEMVIASNILTATETIIEFYIMSCGFQFKFPIKLNNIPRVGDTITFEFDYYLPMKKGVVKAIEHILKGRIHLIKIFVNPDANNEFDYIEWLQDNECPIEVFEKFNKKN